MSVARLREPLVHHAPPPHDPRDRVFLDVIDGWQVRVMEPGGAYDRYLARDGFGHLQFWHPPTGLSLLTPSELTHHEFELYAPRHGKVAHDHYSVMREAARRMFRISLPRTFFVDTLMEVFIESARETTTDRTFIRGQLALERI